MITFKEYLNEIAVKGKAVKGRDDEDDVLKITRVIMIDGHNSFGRIEYQELSLSFETHHRKNKSDVFIDFMNETVISFESTDDFDIVLNLNIINQKKYDEMIEYCKKENIL